jgi:uncharacterized protein
VAYEPRTYRDFASGETVAFQVSWKESDLLCRAKTDLSAIARDALADIRVGLDAYVAANPVFAAAMTPVPDDEMAPVIVRQMIQAARAAGVGPMAAVAGAVAEAVGRKLMESSSVVLVENGGDCFLALSGAGLIPIHAKGSPLSGKIGIRVPLEKSPCGLCTSSGTEGHSLSLGKADAVAVLAQSAALADAVATAAANEVKDRSDAGKAVEWAAGIEGVYGAVALVGKTMAAAGDIELGKTQ